MQGNREAQFKYEEDSDIRAAIKKLEELRSEARKGNLDLPRASTILAGMYESVKESLTKVAYTPHRGNGGKVKNWLRVLPEEIATVIALRECISILSKADGPINLQTLASSIGRLWELEVRIREAEKVNPMYMQKVHEQIKDRNTTSKDHIRKVYNFAYGQVMNGAFDSALSQDECIHLGKHGVQACMDAGLVISTRTTRKCNTSVQFLLHPDVWEFLTDYDNTDVRSIMDKEAGAMLCPPDVWDNLEEGGYLSPRRKLYSPLMSSRNLRNTERRRIRESFTAEKMPVVFEAGNYLQNQAFLLHKPTVEAIARLWRSGGGVLGVPKKNPPVKLACPLPAEWDKSTGTPEELEQFSLWKRAAVQYYDDLSSWKGHTREIAGHIKVSTHHADHPIWFPVYMDTRGRWYYRGTPNPQGSDLARAALHFAEKKMLGARGVFWLKVHIANSFGFDKDRFIDRAAWTDKNWANIERALDEPENHPEVWGTDAPWGMFSAAYELREAYRSGNPATYKTGIIIHMDATCSGLQHFAALLRDPLGARYVNLVDELKCGPKQDIYSRVSALALQGIARDAESSSEELKTMANWWLSAGIPRALAKKPIMTFVYGATLRGTAGFIRDYINNETDLKWPEDSLSYKYCHYAAKKLFEGIAMTVPAAEYAMNWLRKIAAAQPNGKRMEWETPTGFLVQHDYQDAIEKKIFVRSCGLQVVTVRIKTEGTKPIQMQNAIAPNFVHALDASHITFTALRMKKLGLSMVGIHDSYGTHPCDVDTMHRELRVAFIDLYQGRNIMGEFLWNVEALGEAPMRGDLDVSSVLESEFFFS